MSRVEVHLFAAARAAIGSDVIEVEPDSIARILDRLVEAHPDFAAVRPRCSFLLDGLSVADTAFAEAGSRLDVLPPFAGG